MADYPLRSATYHRLGEPLPHQLANTPRVHPKVTAEAVFQTKTRWFWLLCGISTCFQMLSPASGQVTHVLLTSSPLVTKLNQLSASTQLHQPGRVRLACIRHAASVRPEPGSNSHLKIKMIICDSLIVVFIVTSELTSQFVFGFDKSKHPTQLFVENFVQFSKVYFVVAALVARF